MGYDFSQLNDKEFEVLTADLLSTVFQKRIERFKPGKDKGVDGRFFSDKDKEIILQSKHYLKAGYQGLISKLKNEEAKKVKKLNPGKYIFITSLPLSRDNKKEIRNIFSPHIKRDDDIFGQEDLNDLLSKNSQIEEKHFKLWITSSTVMVRIINNAIKGRSEFDLERIKNNSKKYIQTGSHYKALKILKENNVVIISGEPGIGKTTLAENLCLYFVSKDYEFVNIEESVSEAENIYTRGKKQIFYFDDFLGSNYFEAIENKKDSHIVKFIDRVKNDKTKIFILTSRTNILNSGILYSSVFANSKIQKNEFLLTIESLTELDKAKILYNHIWYSKLKEEFIDELYENKRYKKILRHRNFNPRLIEFITDIDRISVENHSKYWTYIEQTLNNPKDIWKDCFKNQNNAYVRNLVSLTVFNGGQISERELRTSFNKIVKLEELKSTSNTEKDFNSMAQLATKSFLNRNRSSSEETYLLFNPSISDFVLSEYGKNIEKLTTICKSLDSTKSLEQVLSLQRENIISTTETSKIMSSIFDDAFQQDKSYDYLIYLSYFCRGDETKKGKIIALLNKMISNPLPIKEFSKLLGLLTDYWNDLKCQSNDFLIKCISNRYLNEEEIKDLAEFLEFYNIDDENILDELRDNVESFITDELNSATNEEDWSDCIVVFENYDGDQDSEINSKKIEERLTDLVEFLIRDFNSDVINDLNIDIMNIVRHVDIDEMLSGFIHSLEPDLEDFRSHSYNFDQDIDDLFERS